MPFATFTPARRGLEREVEHLAFLPLFFRLRQFFVVNRNNYGKRASAVDIAGNSNRAAVVGDDSFDHREPESGSFLFR